MLWGEGVKVKGYDWLVFGGCYILVMKVDVRGFFYLSLRNFGIL